MKYVVLISTCSEKFSVDEFLRPVTQLLQQLKIKYTILNLFEIDISDSELIPENTTNIIICGNSLKDFKYQTINTRKIFDHFIRYLKIPCLGLCAGAQILCNYYSLGLTKEKVIGIKELKSVEFKYEDINTYVLHSNSITLNSIQGNYNITPIYVLRDQPTIVEMCELNFDNLKHTLCFFHPEIKNHSIIQNWIDNNGKIIEKKKKSRKKKI